RAWVGTYRPRGALFRLSEDPLCPAPPPAFDRPRNRVPSVLPPCDGLCYPFGRWRSSGSVRRGTLPARRGGPMVGGDRVRMTADLPASPATEAIETALDAPRVVAG